MTPTELAALLAGLAPTHKTSTYAPGGTGKGGALAVGRAGGISVAEMAVMLALLPAGGTAPAHAADDRGRSVTYVQDALGWSIATTSETIARLLVRGIVTREPHPQDRRRHIVRLTAKGWVILRSGRKSLAETLAAEE